MLPSIRLRCVTPTDLPIFDRRGSLALVTIEEISVDELAPLIAEGARLIDVREPSEFTEARVPEAVLVSLATVPDHVDQFMGEGTTYVICRSGGRSMQACEFVAAQGANVVNVAGGTLAWIETGRDVATGDS
jgi:rhodanese-related sulfurtransferase